MGARDQALEALNQFMEDCGVEFGIEMLGVFGSVARDMADGESDVDVVVKMNPLTCSSFLECGSN